jgi:hypothetical protein
MPLKNRIKISQRSLIEQIFEQYKKLWQTPHNMDVARDVIRTKGIRIEQAHKLHYLGAREILELIAKQCPQIEFSDIISRFENDAYESHFMEIDLEKMLEEYDKKMKEKKP